MEGPRPGSLLAWGAEMAKSGRRGGAIGVLGLLRRGSGVVAHGGRGQATAEAGTSAIGAGAYAMGDAMEEGWAPGGGGEAGVWRRCGGGAATEIQREGGGKEEERKVGFGWDRARWSEGGDASRGGAEAIRWWESFVCRAGAEGVGSGATGGWAEPRAGEAMRAGFLRTKFVLLFILFSSRYIYTPSGLVNEVVFDMI
jgi:hypothetical protein